MSITLPNHAFSYWSDPKDGDSPPALIVGAGFSAPQVRLPDHLAKHCAENQSQIERVLKISTGFKFNDKLDDLYSWAGVCIEELKNKGEQDHVAKQKLIDAIGLLEDPAFFARANIPLRGTTPRHRVFARLAREGAIYSVWSLNWDLWLESAFEAVGLVRKGSAGTGSADVLPKDWKKSYRVFLPSDSPEESNICIPLYKPHGCIGQFVAQANNTFKITKAELEEAVPANVKQRLLNQLDGRPVCAIGWGATEENLQKVFVESANANGLKKNELTIVSLEWNGDTHSKLAANFGQIQTNTLCAVQKNTPGTTDDLMQWIQALRTLRRFKAVVTGLTPTNATLSQLIAQQIDVFKSPVFYRTSFGWALSWFDTFVPVWSRVCFSVRAIVFEKDGDIPVSVLPMTRRDEHIPLNDGNIKRWDILSAAHLYATLLSINSVEASEFDFENFPGAFLHKETRWLLIPIPMWADVGDVSLAAIKPLMESRHWSDMSRVKGVCLLRISRGVDEVVAGNGDSIAVWKQGVASLMKLGAFARAENIDDCDVRGLPAYLQNKKDTV